MTHLSSDLDSERIGRTIVAKIAELAPGRLSTDATIAGQQNLLEFVDSFGFVNLMMMLEESLGLTMDLANANLADLVRYQNMVEFIQAQTPRLELSA